MSQTQKQVLTISLLAYKKIIYHLLRYSSSKVYGALTSSNTNASLITNSYPLFHSPLTNPTLSTALDLIQSNLQSNQQIVGFYQFTQSGQAAMTRILEGSVIFKGIKVLRVFVEQENKDKIRFAANGVKVQHPEFSQVQKDIIQGKHHFIVDFDAHFQEIQLDFTNQYVK